MKQEPVFFSAGLIALTVLAAGACVTEAGAGTAEKEVPDGRMTPGGVSPASRAVSVTSKTHKPV